MGGKTSAKSKNAWNAKNYDRVGLMLAKGDKDQIKASAAAADQSVNAWIVAAINDKVTKELQK